MIPVATRPKETSCQLGGFRTEFLVKMSVTMVDEN